MHSLKYKCIHIHIGANVARSTLKFHRIQYIFKQALKLLSERMETNSDGGSILSSIIKVEHHPHTQPRKQGTRFKSGYTWIETGLPVVKMGRKRFGSKLYEEPPEKQRRVGDYKREERYQEDDYRNNDYREERNSYRNNNRDERRNTSRNSYRAEPYTKRYDNYNEREYQRHKRNNNSHLAEHYRNKSRR